MTRMVDADDLISALGVAWLLGCGRSRAHQIVRQPDFPAPVVRVGMKTELWLGAEVAAWRDAKPERPAPRQCGTLAGYVGGCRCSECRAANTAYQAEWRRRQTP